MGHKMARHKDKQPSDVVVGSGDVNRFRRLLKPGIISIIALCFVAAAYLSGRWAYNQFFEQTSDDALTNKTVCSEELLSKAANQLKEDNLEELTSTVQEVEALPDYQKDPNCLGVVTTYYVKSGDAVKARAHYDQLVPLYELVGSYSPTLAGQILLPENMRSAIEFLEKQTQELQNNNGGQYGGTFGDKRVE